MTEAGDMVKVESIVSDFLSAQSLKVLPQGPFGDAVNQFVSKDDKHAMELFVTEHLTGQVQQLLGLESDDEDLNSAMDIYRTRIEQQMASGTGVRSHMPERKRVLKPKPAHWDSDFDGAWEDEPDAYTYEDVHPASMAPTTQPSQRSRGKSQPQEQDVDVEDDEPPARATKRGAAKAAPAKRAPAKKAAPAKKPPARGPGRKAAPPSDEEEEEEDVVMESEEEEPPPPPKRTARKAAAAPAKPAARGGGKQTKLNFSQSQSQAPTQTRRAATQKKAVEISDDEISDEDDAFEPAPVASRTRRR